MAPRKKTVAKVETVDEVEETIEETVEEAVEAAPAPVVIEEVQAEVVAPTTKRGIPNNTWTLTYGTHTIDLVEGRAVDMPIDVYEYLRRQGNLVARL